MARVKTKFSSTLSGEDLTNFIKSYRAASLAREEIVRVIKKDLDSLTKDEEDVKHLKNPNWQLNQAHSLGYRKALRYAIDLLSQDLEE